MSSEGVEMLLAAKREWIPAKKTCASQHRELQFGFPAAAWLRRRLGAVPKPHGGGGGRRLSFRFWGTEGAGSAAGCAWGRSTAARSPAAVVQRQPREGRGCPAAGTGALCPQGLAAGGTPWGWESRRERCSAVSPEHHPWPKHRAVPRSEQEGRKRSWLPCEEGRQGCTEGCIDFPAALRGRPAWSR